MPTAPRARSFALKGLQFYGNLINFCRGALACHCEFRTGLRRSPNNYRIRLDAETPLLSLRGSSCDEAIEGPRDAALDRFAALAMTGGEWLVYFVGVSEATQTKPQLETPWVASLRSQ